MKIHTRASLARAVFTFKTFFDPRASLARAVFSFKTFYDPRYRPPTRIFRAAAAAEEKSFFNSADNWATDS